MASAIGACCIPQMAFYHSQMAEALETLPADMGRICIPGNVYAMIMVMHRGRGSGMASGANMCCWLWRPCRQVPRDGDFNPLCRPCFHLSRLHNLSLLNWRFPGSQRRGRGGSGSRRGSSGCGCSFVKQFGLSWSCTSVAPKMNFGIDWVT